MKLSIITPTYNTPRAVLARTWASLKAQTYTNWEWVVYDDSEGWETYNQLYGFCADERYTIHLHRPDTPSGGNIGYVKNKAFHLGSGEYLLELDHDDQLTPDCLENIYQYIKYQLKEKDTLPYFIYTNWAEIDQNYQSCTYPDGWGYGLGKTEWDAEKQVWAHSLPNLTLANLQHIVSVPNHLRAWRKDYYRAIGGHDRNLELADDYDLMIRTLKTTEEILHIDKTLYFQHINPHTTSRIRNSEIQAIVQKLKKKYNV